MRTIYAIQAELSAEDTGKIRFESVRGHVLDWVGGKYKRSWNQDLEFPTESGTVQPLEGHSIKCLSRASDGVDLWSVDWRHPDDHDPTVAWAPSIAIGRMDDRVQFSLQVRIAADEMVLRPTRFKLGRPNIVTRLLQDYTARVNGWAVPASIDRIKAPEVDHYVDQVLLSASRSLPVVMVSPDAWSGRFHVDSEDLFDALRGFAHVCVLEDKWAAFKLTDAVEKSLSTYNGAVRVYWPGFQLDDDPFTHRLFLAPAVRHRESSSLTLGRYLFRSMAAISAFRYSEGRVLRKAREFFADADRSQLHGLRGQVKRGEVEKQELEEKLLEALIKIEELEDTRDSLQEELDAQKAAWSEFQSFVAADTATDEGGDAESEATEPSTVLEAVQRAKRDFSGPLVFLDSVEQSAAESPFKNPERAYELFEALHLVADEWRKNGGNLGQSWNDAMRDLGFDFRDQISATSKGKWGDEYKFNYKGEKRLFEKHVTIGAKQADKCLSVHLFRDDHDRVLVIGHCGRHLTNTKA